MSPKSTGGVSARLAPVVCASPADVSRCGGVGFGKARITVRRRAIGIAPMVPSFRAVGSVKCGDPYPNALLISILVRFLLARALRWRGKIPPKLV